MKKFKNIRKEGGAITLMTAILLVVLLGFTALAIDFGLHYVSGAKLQNAVDAAATAAAAGIGDVDQSVEDTAWDYLRLNGYDKAEINKYNADGTLDKENIKLTIDKKGVVDLETVDDESYITAGYYKLTVEVTETTLFARALGVDSMKLVKHSYVRCKPNYVEMPRALNYTIFAGSTKGTTAEPAMKVDGRTADWVNNTANFFERAINWTNATIVQPIIGWFGGNPDYNELVHINLSEIVSNGDVHSNSNIRIGVQALNVSRIKDRDFEGSTFSSDEDWNEEASKQDIEELSAFDDYGQVTFTAVKDIKFSNSLKNNHDSSTHIYVQNQQYLEQTQVFLNVLNYCDFAKCTDTDKLRAEYRNKAETYISRTFNLTDSQKEAIRAQAEYIRINDEGNIIFDYTGETALLQNQKQIVYNISQGKAEQFLAEAKEQGITDLYNEVERNGTDPVFRSGTSTLLFANQADKSSDLDYDIQFSRAQTDEDDQQVYDSEGKPVYDKLNLTVQGLAVSRNYTQLGSSAPDSTTSAAKFAIARTFQENSEYIPMPNLKPYFTRQINRSVRNATKTKEQSGSSTAGDRNVKAAVDTKGKEYQAIMKASKNKYQNGTDDKGEPTYEYTYEDRKYNTPADYINKDKTPLFTQKKANANSGLTYYYTLDEKGNRVYDTRHTEFKGYQLYNGNTLKTPSTFVSEFYNKHLNPSSGDKDYGAAAVNQYYLNKVSKDYFTRNQSGVNSTGGTNAVRDKKTEINTTQQEENQSTVVEAENGGTKTITHGQSYTQMEKVVKEEITSIAKPVVEANADQSSVEAQKSFTYPTNYNDLFLGDGSVSVNGSTKTISSTAGVRATYNTEFAKIKTTMSDLKTLSEINNAYFSIPSTSGSSAGSPGKIKNDGTLTISGTTWYTEIHSPYYESWGKWRKGVELSADANVIVKNDFNLTATSTGNPAPWLTTGARSKLYIEKYLEITTGADCTIGENAYLVVNNSGNYGNGAISLTSGSYLRIGDNATVVVLNGDVNVDGLFMGTNAKLYCNGSIRAKKAFSNGSGSAIYAQNFYNDWGAKNYTEFTNNGKIYLTGDFNLKYNNNNTVNLVNNGEMYVGNNLDMGKITNSGSLYVKGAINSYNTDNGYSVVNSGTLLANSNLTAYGTVQANGGTIYVLGNMKSGNSTANGSNMLHMSGAGSKVYVRGALYSDSNKQIWIQDTATNSVLSILGNGYSDACNSTCTKIENNSSSNKSYFGKSLTISSTNPFYNKSQMYVFGTLTLSSATSGTFTASNTSYVDGDLVATSTDVSVNGGHMLFVRGEIKVKSLTADGSSTWVHSNKITASGTITVSGSAFVEALTGASADGGYNTSGGTLHGPQTVSISNGVGINLTVPHYIYDTNGGTLTVPNLSLSNSVLKIIGDLNVSGNIILNNSTLYVTGNIICSSEIQENNSRIFADHGIGVSSTNTSKPTQITLNNNSLMLCRNDIDATTLKNFVVSTLEKIVEWFNPDKRANIYCRGNIAADNTSRVFAEGIVEASSAIANNSSKIYGFYALNLTGTSSAPSGTTTGGKFQTGNAASKIFCGEKSSNANNIYLVANGKFYYPTSTIKLNHVEVNDGGYVVMMGNANVDTSAADRSKYNKPNYFTIASGGYFYDAGKTTFNGCYIDNSGEMYLLGGIDYTNAWRRGRVKTGTKNVVAGYYLNFCDIIFNNNSISYIGQNYVNGSANNTFTFNSHYEARGDVYFENSVSIADSDGILYSPEGATDNEEHDSFNWRPIVPNVGSNVLIWGGTTFVSGSFTVPDNTALTIADEIGSGLSRAAGLVIKDNLNMGCTIWNYGRLIIGNQLNLNNSASNITDTKDSNKAKGISVKNGENEASNASQAKAVFYVGAENNPLTLIGYIRNAGNVYMCSSLRVQGSTDDKGTTGVAEGVAYVNFAYAKTHINGNLQCCSSQIVNRGYGQVGITGKLTYGGAAFNCGEMYVTGDITNNEVASETNGKTFKYRNKDTSFSFMNGLYKIDESVVDGSDRYYDATVYCGGTMQFGYQVDNGGPAGSMINLGEVYVANDLNIYTFDQTVTSSDWTKIFTGGGLLAGIFGAKNSYFYTAYLGFNGSKTFVGRNFFGGSGVSIGNNSIFMCGGDYKSSRASKFGINVHFRKAGFNIFNIIKTDNVPVCDYDDTDLFDETYVYIGGNAIINSFGKTNYQWGSNAYSVPLNASRDCDIYSNTNMYVGGSFFANSQVYMKQNVTLMVAGNKDFYESNGNLLQNIFEAFTSATARANITALLDGTNYKFFIYQSLDENVCSKIIVNGGGYVQDTCKMRDMAKNYFYGDFRCKDYFELGKALDGNDETEAKESGFRTPEETKWITNNSLEEYNEAYKFANETYMYVGGNFESGGQYSWLTNLLFSKSYTKLFASATLRVNGDVISNKYITLRHDAKLFANGKVEADTNIDGGSYSNIVCAGDLKAKLGTMKIRDQVTVCVGGNATALQYIELGKCGDFVRTQHTINKVEALEGGEAKYNGEEEEKNGDAQQGDENNNTGDGNYNEQGEQSGTTENGGSTQTSDEGYEYGTTLDTTNELTADSTDESLGGDFFIAGSLITYTGYIKEFGYSFASIGGIVYTPKYLTLRHNSDMWVLPELYMLYGDKDNKTYEYTPYVSTSDGSIFGDIIDLFKRVGHEVKETFSPHNGTIYTMGELTLNKNASLLGTYDAQVLGQCVLREDSLVYVGHDFNCNAPSVNISLDLIRGNESVVGFDSYGKAGTGWRYTCKNYAKHDGYYYNMVVRDTEKPASGYVKCDVCGNLIPASEAVKCQVSYPAVVYAYNNIDVNTTIQMRMTYLVANKGDVSLYNVYTKTENAEQNAKELPNAICSYLGHINYFGMYSKLGALFYAPTESTKYDENWFTGNRTKVESITLDGYYNEIWGCVLGDTVDMSSYYLTLHRFENWRTMDLHVVESGNVFIIPERVYEAAAPNVEDIYLDDKYTTGNTSISSEGARQFFFGDSYYTNPDGSEVETPTP